MERFIEVSTAQVYSGDKKSHAEDGKIKPWTQIAVSKLAAEEALLGIEGFVELDPEFCVGLITGARLNVVIVRPAIVYGPGDVAGICRC